MADKDLSELINQLEVSARATEALASAQRTAAQAIDRLVASIGNLNRQVLKGANEFGAVSRSVAGYASALRAVASAQMEIAKAQTPASASLKAMESAASAGAEKLKAARDTAKDLTGVMVDTAASLALGEAPLKVLIGRGADLSKVLLKAKIDGVDLGAAFGSVSGSAGMLEAAAMGVTGAQLAQAVASRVAGGAAGEAAAKNVIAAETAVAATLATSEAAVASRGLSAALLGAVGGPVGLVVGALVAGVTALAFAQRDAAQSSVAAAGASDVSAQAISDLNEILHQDPTPGVTANIREYTKAQLDRAKAIYEVARADLMAKKAGAEARLSDLEDGVVTEKTGPRGTYRQRRLSTFGTRAGSELERERGAAREAAKSAADGLTTLDAGYDRTNKAILAHSKQLERAQNASLGNTQAIKAHTVAQSADDEAWSRGVEASEDFARALSEEIAVMGLSNEEIRRREINLQILNAPTSKLHDHLVDLCDQWELQTSVMKEAKVQQEAVAKQQGETLHTMRDVIGDGPHFSTIFEDITDALTKNVAQADAARTSIEGIATALNKNDWTGALGGMVHLLEQLEKAFGKAGTTAEKFSAAAGVAQGIGGIIGGKTGSAISGIASGALSGASLGSVVPGIGTAVGAAVGAVIGGLGSLFGSSKAKKQAKAQAAAEEAQRQAQIAAQGVDLDIQIAEANGDTATAKRLRRQQTLGGIAPANQARQQQLFDIEDAKQREAEIKAVNDALTSLSMVFGSVGDATDAARDRLIKLSGGLEAFTSQTAFFAEHFLSEDERLKPVKDSVSSELKRLGLSPDLTREGFKNLVLTQDVSTEGGAKLYAALMTLAPAFDKVATAAEAAKAAVEDKKTSILDQIDALVLSPAEQLAKSRKAEMEAVKALDETLAPFLETLWKAQDAAEAAKLATDRSNMYADLLEAQGRSEEAKALRRANALAAIDDPIQKQYQQQIWAAEDAAAKVAAARDVLTQAYQREHDALQATKDKFADLSKSLRAFSAGLSGTIAGADLAGRYRTTRQSFLTTASLARLGDPDAMGRLQAEGEAFTAASRDYVSTSQDYLRDVGLVRSAVDEAADTADRQVSIAQQQLEALDASVEGLIQINASVVSVRDAIAGLQGALAQQAAVLAAPAPVPTSPKPETNSTWANPGKTLDGKYYYDSMLGGIAYSESQRDPQYYPGGVNPALTPGTQSYSLLETYKVKDQLSYLNQSWPTYRFATGGGFEVGGSGPPDSKLFNLALSPGEAVNVRRRGDSGDEALINELRRLREELADLRATSARIATSNDKMERTLTNVTEGGRAMQTQAAA